jgi:hypothetical protein
MMKNRGYSFWSDPGMIAVEEEEQRLFWAARFGTSVEELKTAVRATQSLSYVELEHYLDQCSKNSVKDKKHVKN